MAGPWWSELRLSGLEDYEGVKMLLVYRTPKSSLRVI